MPIENIDIESAARSTLDSDAVFKNLLSMYAIKLGDELKNIETALLQRDWSAVKMQAHRLKGTASMYGFTTLSQLFAACEIADTNAEAFETARSGLEIAKKIRGKLLLNYPQQP